MLDIGKTATGRAELANAVGLHARPSVRFTQLAKTFHSAIEFAIDAEGPWIDAKSPVKVMRAKAPKGAVLHIVARGPDAEDAVAALVRLIEDKFGEE